MSIFDVVLSTEDIVVLGPPNVIDLSVDVGPKGDRGSRIFSGSGNPNNFGVIPDSEEVLLGDLFINSSIASDYSWLYVYASRPGTVSWVPTLKLQTPIYNKTIQASFNASGVANISIALEDILSDLSIIDVDRYIVQVTPINENPISLSVYNKSITYSPSIVELTATISDIVGNGTNVIFTTTTDHGFSAGQRVSITGVNPSNYNLSLVTIASIPTATSFAIENTNTATYVSGGLAKVKTTPSSFNMSLKAVEFSSSTWSELQGVEKMAITISVV